MKEVKVPHPYKVHYKIHVPYIIKQEIHTVPVHSHPVHSSEHIHHHSSHNSGSHHPGASFDASSGSGSSSGFSPSSDYGSSSDYASGPSSGSNFDYGSSSGFGSNAGYSQSSGSPSYGSQGFSSNVAPMIASHTPVAVVSPSTFSQRSAPRPMALVSMKSVQQSAPQQNQIPFISKAVQQQPAPKQSQISAAPKFVQPPMTKNVFQSTGPTYMTGLNTMFQASAGGFKTQEAGSSSGSSGVSSGSSLGGYQVREATSETGPALFTPNGGKTSENAVPQEAVKAGSSKSFMAYPYPLMLQNEKNPFEYSFGFKPSDPLYGF